MSSFGDKIKYRRIKLGLTVDDVAKASNLHKEEIYHLEKSNILNAHDDAIKQLAAVLRIHSDSLFGVMGKLPNDLMTIFRKRPSLIASILREMDACNTEYLKLVQAILTQRKHKQPRINNEDFDAYWKVMEKHTRVID